MSSFSKTIQAIASIKPISRYLEIGVSKGDTFLSIDLPEKTGVDPNFKFDITRFDNYDNIHLFSLSSDVFFSSLPEIQERVYNTPPIWDLIFIDGLHTFKQVLNDFENSIKYAHDETVWIIDDVLPSDPYSAVPDMALSLKMRSLANLSGTPWHGDVFKLIYALHDFFNEFSYVTIIDNGNPHALVWRNHANHSRARLFESVLEIDNMSYFDMCATCAILNPVPFSQAIELIGNTIDVPVQLSQALLPTIIKPLRMK